ncbi:hypothetical protein OG453_20255 [Streptomyces sp. NBC_01381]|nr:hypothetical protein [Streptomyces sp. NBC_01381]MCX4668976.1 hypothetical protein [Streptomyces sp. NBC_01381]
MRTEDRLPILTLHEAHDLLDVLAHFGSGDDEEAEDVGPAHE